MANEYAVNHADLKAVAKAIRDKGKTTEVLTFPVGFISAVEAISGGGGLNFEVVGGTEQPENPAENTIWVETETEITEWTFQPSDPSEPVEGMVWIKTANRAQIDINATTKNSIILYLTNSLQYNSATWVTKPTKIYQSGEWKDWWSGQLYDSGNEWTDITGGWQSRKLKWDQGNSDGLPTIVKNSTTMTIAADKVSKWCSGFACPVNTIDLTNYTTLTVVLSGLVKPEEASGLDRCGIMVIERTAAYAANYVALLPIPSMVVGINKIPISLSGFYDVGFYFYNDERYDISITVESVVLS